MQRLRSRYHCLHCHTLWCLPSEPLLPTPYLKTIERLLAYAWQRCGHCLCRAVSCLPTDLHRMHSAVYIGFAGVAGVHRGWPNLPIHMPLLSGIPGILSLRKVGHMNLRTSVYSGVGLHQRKLRFELKDRKQDGNCDTAL